MVTMLRDVPLASVAAVLVFALLCAPRGARARRASQARSVGDDTRDAVTRATRGLDAVSAGLAYLEEVQASTNCSAMSSLHFDARLAGASLSGFAAQAAAARRVANTLNTMFRGAGASLDGLYNDVFFYALARSLVTSDATSDAPSTYAGSDVARPFSTSPPPPPKHVIFGATVAFDRDQYGGGGVGGGGTKRRHFAPYAYRAARGDAVHVRDLALATQPMGKYTVNGTEGFEWFWRLRGRDYSELLFPARRMCADGYTAKAAELYVNATPGVETGSRHGVWTRPYYDCYGARAWVVTYAVPFFGCNIPPATATGANTPPTGLGFKGVVAIDILLDHVDINQCADDSSLFAGTHKCRPSTKCVHVPHQGFHRGTYQCHCAAGYYYAVVHQPGADNSGGGKTWFEGSDVERAYLSKILNQSENYDFNFTCVPCAQGCVDCVSDAPCLDEYDGRLRMIPLGLQSFCMTISIVLAVVIVRLRKTKVMKASFWILLEIIILGALLLYATVVIQFFEPTEMTCMLVPWFRELGFAVVYGALTLKIYRVLAEFQSRKAHRVHVRDKDLLKYLAGIALIVVGYMAAWTAINMDHIREGNSMVEVGESLQTGLKYYICKSRWWDYVIEIGELLFLVFSLYLCKCVKSAPSDYGESRFITFAIAIETLVSLALHIIRHLMWLTLSPDYIFLMYFLRCQLTVTVTLILVLGPKLWYAHHPPEDDCYRSSGRAYSSSDVHDSILPESIKLHVAVSSNGDVDVGDINLSEMDPEDIRAELKRLYTQLQIYKTKTLRKDNPHISKRRGGRKQTHRRFSLQAFHHKHRHHHRHGGDSSISADHEISRTPEESTNSAEGIGYSIEESVCSMSEAPTSVRTPTVTFKPGHQSNIY